MTTNLHLRDQAASLSAPPPDHNGKSDFTPILFETSHAPARSPQRQRTPFWVWGVILIILVGGGWLGYRWLFPERAALPEITREVTRGTLLVTVTERGDLESSNNIDVACELEGRENKIVEILPEGTALKKGQIVIRFETEEIARQIIEQEIKVKQDSAKARAAKEKLEAAKQKAAGELAKAELALLTADLEKEMYLEGDYKVELDERKGAIALAEKDLQEAQEKLDHYRKFVKDGFGTPEQLRLKETDLERTRFSLSRDKAKLEVLQKYMRKKKDAELTAKAIDAAREMERVKRSNAAAIAEAESDLDAAEATAKLQQQALDRLRAKIKKCEIAAPQDGILVYSKAYYYDTGSRVRPGAIVHYQQPLFSLPDLAKMQVKMKVHEAVVKKVKPDQKAEIRIESYPKAVLTGTVKKVATLANNERWDERGVKEFDTIITIDDLPKDADLRPGMTAEVKIMVSEFPDVLLVPVQAVTQREQSHFSYVLVADGVQRKQVLVGESNEKFVEIKEGLNQGDRVALDARLRMASEIKASGGKDETPTPKPVEPRPNPGPPQISQK